MLLREHIKSQASPAAEFVGVSDKLPVKAASSAFSGPELIRPYRLPAGKQPCYIGASHA